jgi:hypothetical protein
MGFGVSVMVEGSRTPCDSFVGTCDVSRFHIQMHSGAFKSQSTNSRKWVDLRDDLSVSLSLSCSLSLSLSRSLFLSQLTSGPHSL